MKYHYTRNGNGNNLNEECKLAKYGRTPMIGSYFCTESCHCVDYNNNEQWVICDRLTIKSRKQKLEKLNNENN
jgi:hypothetical protein